MDQETAKTLSEQPVRNFVPQPVLKSSEFSDRPPSRDFVPQPVLKPGEKMPEKPVQKVEANKENTAGEQEIGQTQLLSEDREIGQTELLTEEQYVEKLSDSSDVELAQPPEVQLKTNRSVLKLILLSCITLGIYGLVYYSKISKDINTIATPHDGKKTMHFMLALILAPITLGITMLVWYHNVSDRIGQEIERRKVPYDLDAATFWAWCLLGSFILVGPLVFAIKLAKAMNILSEDYNAKG